MTSKGKAAGGPTSSPALDEAFVWVFLPGDTSPTLCGRFRHAGTAAGMPVGTFAYGKSYLGNPAARPLDPFVLPLANKSFEIASSQGVFGVFADACPDDWGRYVIDRQYGAQAYPIGYLLRSQEDRVGHLCFSASRSEMPSLAAPVSTDLLNDAWHVVADLEAGRPIPPELADRIRPNTAMGGARPKLTVADQDAQWLAKFPVRGDNPRRSVPKLEAAILVLAGLCKIDAAKAKLVPIERIGDHDMALLVRRFDRTARMVDGEQVWLRDGYVSARTVLQSSPSLHAASYTGAYCQLARELQRWSEHAPADRFELFRRMVFNCCISNIDDHERNHGFLASDASDLYRLSPAFDMVPRLHGTARRHRALAIGDFGHEATVANLLSACGDFDLHEAESRGLIDEVETTVQENWRRVLLEHGIDGAAVDELAPCFAPLPGGR